MGEKFVHIIIFAKSKSQYCKLRQAYCTHTQCMQSKQAGRQLTYTHTKLYSRKFRLD